MKETEREQRSQRSDRPGYFNQVYNPKEHSWLSKLGEAQREAKRCLETRSRSENGASLTNRSGNKTALSKKSLDILAHQETIKSAAKSARSMRSHLNVDQDI